MKDFLLRLCRMALGILGVASIEACDGEPDPGSNIMCEYGTPYSKFEIKGKVVDKETGKPLTKIEVEAFTQVRPDGEILLRPIWPKDTTGLDGLISINGDGMVFNDNVVLKCRDLDASDGDYGEVEVTAPLTAVDNEGAGNWYRGKYVYDASEVEMTEKTGEGQ
ncbi:MAG: radical SAM-associated putative lipoprotein [Bacteroidales bacterium]|nr:radical SAM-associated putative lipoprotein [Bacteroides sp.]MCM1199372.1 radical SAM-associated putative lipoprotein [Clostridium sp.]MCM1501342.1 radical SAM-associated putative lipoprotein [Bacteroidales bacterium]